MKSSIGIFRKKVGLPPGTLTYTGVESQEEVSISVIKYDEDHYESKESNNLKEILKEVSADKVNWLNINGLHDVQVVQETGNHFELHPLLLEDILNTGHLPKMEDYGNHLFLTTKMLSLDPGDQSVNQEQISFVLGHDYLLTFQEKKGDVFDQIRERLEKGLGKARQRNSDYLFYLLVDRIVDNYYIVLEKFESDMERLEENMLDQTSSNTAETILAYKKQLISLRRNIFPMKEEIGKLFSEETPLISKHTNIYFKDVFDHLDHIYHNLESFRESLNGLMELLYSHNADKMNSVMKTLTMIATIFIPLTFLAGIYGMNFQHMPELDWKWGYPIALLIMFTVGISMFIYMKRRKWF